MTVKITADARQDIIKYGISEDNENFNIKYLNFNVNTSGTYQVNVPNDRKYYVKVDVQGDTMYIDHIKPA